MTLPAAGRLRAAATRVADARFAAGLALTVLCQLGRLPKTP